jgi:hypothetical protein
MAAFSLKKIVDVQRFASETTKAIDHLLSDEYYSVLPI